jgi:FkbM family methyltransferase
MIILKRKVDKFTMHLCPSDGGISRVLMNRGKREAGFMHLIRENINTGDICFDLGANIGYATLFMADKCGASGKVYAIEPDPHNLNLLNLTIEENNFQNIVDVEQCMVSNIDKDQDFWIARAPNLNSVHKTKHSIRKIVVKSHRLDSFLENKECPNFIKMDVEGHEVQILDAAVDYFSKQDKNIKILMEVHPQYYSEENSLEKVFEKYFASGFNCKHIISTPNPQPKLFKDSGYEPIMSFKTDGFHRGLYENIKNEDAIKFTCRLNREGSSKKIARSIMIEKKI